jgi:hypothetical protein
VNKNGIFPNCYSFLAITNSKMKIYVLSKVHVFFSKNNNTNICLSLVFWPGNYIELFEDSKTCKFVAIEYSLNFDDFIVIKRRSSLFFEKKTCTLLNTFFCTCRLKSNSLKEFWCKKNVLQWIIILYWRLYYDQALWNFLFHFFNLT